MDPAMSQHNVRQSIGCLTIFGLPFLAVGIGMCGMILGTARDWYTMRTWVQVPAQIKEVRLETHAADDSITFRAVARYEYFYQGKKYVGDRVAVSTLADNMGDYHQRKVKELTRSKELGRAVPCFVDPTSPDRSVLYRDLRLENIACYALFGLAFGSFGGSMIGYGYFSARQSRNLARLRRDHPDEPWRYRKDWASGQIQSSSQLQMVSALAFTLFWNLVSSPVLFYLPAALQRGNHMAWLQQSSFRSWGLVPPSGRRCSSAAGGSMARRFLKWPRYPRWWGAVSPESSEYPLI